MKETMGLVGGWGFWLVWAGGWVGGMGGIGLVVWACWGWAVVCIPFFMASSSAGSEVISLCSWGEATTFMATWLAPAKKRPSPTAAAKSRFFSPWER